MFNFLRKKYYNSNKQAIQIVDTSFIMNKYGRNKIARNKFFKNKNCNKISLLTDVKGIPLSVFVNKGTIHDISFMNRHIRDCYFIYKNKNNILLADKGYVSKNLRNELNKNNCKLMVPKKKNMLRNHYFDKNIYKNES